MKSIVTHATEENKQINQDTQNPQKVQLGANKILELMADKIFCRVVANTSPTTAIALYNEMENNNKYNIKVKSFTRNLISEAINEKSSFIYRGIRVYDSKTMGYKNPISRTLFSNYKMSDAIETTLCPNITDVYNWDTDQWQIYF